MTINRQLVTLSLLLFIIIKPAMSQVVAVHPNLIQEKVSQQTLRAIFSMRRNKWPDGTPIRVFVLNSENLDHREFCKTVLGVFPYQLQRTWDSLVYSGTGQAPLQVKSVAEMKEKIINTPGSIGYLPEDSVDEQTFILEIN